MSAVLCAVVLALLAPADGGSTTPVRHDTGSSSPSAVENRLEPLEVGSQATPQEASPAEPPSAPPAASAPQADPGRPGDTQAMSELSLAQTGLAQLRYGLNFFGDVSLVANMAGDRVSLESELGTFDALFNAALGNSIGTAVEVAFEHGEVEIERFEISWRGGDFFLRGGKSHTTLGYWNTAYHHGKWLQPTIERPRGARFDDGGGLLPNHWVGLEGGRRFAAPWGAVILTAGVGNGRKEAHEEKAPGADAASSRLVLPRSAWLNVDFQSAGLPEMHLGLSALYGRILAAGANVRPALPDVPIDERIGAAHAVYRGDRLLFIAEGLLVEHAAGGRSWRTLDGFAVAMLILDRLSPYAQVEVQRISASGDPFYNPGVGTPLATPQNLVEVLLGLRVDVSAWSSLKLEYRLTFPRGAIGPDQALQLNCSFGI